MTVRSPGACIIRGRIKPVEKARRKKAPGEGRRRESRASLQGKVRAVRQMPKKWAVAAPAGACRSAAEPPVRMPRRERGPFVRRCFFIQNAPRRSAGPMPGCAERSGGRRLPCVAKGAERPVCKQLGGKAKLFDKLELGGLRYGFEIQKSASGGGIARPRPAARRRTCAPCAATKALPCSPWGVR